MRAKLEQYQILLMLIAAAAMSGGVGAFSKLGLQSFPPVTFTFLRFVTATVILLPVLLLREKKFKMSKLALLIFVSLLAVTNIMLYILGVSHTTATISQTLYAAVPLFSAVIMFGLYGDRLNRKKELGLFIGFIGVLIIVFLPMLGKASVNNGTLLGNLLIFAGVLCVAFYSIFSKKLQETYSPLLITTTFILLTVIIQALLLPFSGGFSLNLSHASASSIIAVIYTGIFGTGIYYVLYQYVIKKATPVIASLSLYLQPIFGALWAWALLGESVTAGFLVGAVLALAGVYLVTTGGAKNAKTK